MTTPFESTSPVWDRLTEERDATAAELESDGWEVLTLTTGDVTPRPARESDVGKTFIGLNVLVPGNEFRELEPFVDDTAFDSYEVYKSNAGDTMLLLIVMKATTEKRAVCFPAYYDISQASYMISEAEAAGEMETIVRPLSDDRRVVFSHHDVSLLLPERVTD